MEGLKWWWWKIRVNWLSWKYGGMWSAIECAPAEAREAFDDEETPWDYYVEAFCRE